MFKNELMQRLAEITPEEKALLDGNAEFDCSLYVESSSNEKINIFRSKKFLNIGRIITIRKHTRFVHVPPHKHDYIEVCYMLSGTTEHILNGTKLPLHEGELLFLSQSVTQEILPAGPDDLGINFIILPEFFDTTIKMLDAEDTPLHRFLLGCLRGDNAESSYMHFKVADVIPIQNLLHNLIWMLLNKPHGRRKINQNTMGVLIMHLMDYTDRLTYENETQQFKIQVLSYIDEHYRDGSLEILSKLIGYDMTVLSKEIKKNFGKNYTDLVQEKRLDQAKFLLKTTRISIADIGADVGYENTSYFYRIFQKYNGLTPREYRKLARSSIK